MPSFVDVLRGPHLESRHRLSVAVVRSDGTRIAHSGDPTLTTFWRSAAKFFQAIPVVASGAADALGLTDAELALACASHNGEPRHVETARLLLDRSGSAESDLHCGPHPSLNEDLARTQLIDGDFPSRLHSNCSGKHAAMLANAAHNGWPKQGYERGDHPVQQACLDTVAAWTSLPREDIGCATDGCGVPSFALPLESMALAYARLAASSEGLGGGFAPQKSQRAGARLLAAVKADPFLIAGTGRLDTELVKATGGRIVAKIGADGVYCAAIPEQALGIALKVEDGAVRALAPALLAVLDEITPGMAPGLEWWRHPVVSNSNDEKVGTIEARVDLIRDAMER